ncbi:hypothetical protein ETB97_009148 [Aspergillus alliaceus]|uniref:Uncharacterized protein n=1 Tax=Petromyces alliaceus TaxID=209559 RepID=A0A8H6AAY6_PETAA|nr:hypothetical protein ETB97_009148 [Aspergillus burnettii]
MQTLSEAGVTVTIACRTPRRASSRRKVHKSAQLPWIFLTLWALHNQVKAVGVIIPSEIGQDPGIDPLYAVKTTEMRFTMRVVALLLSPATAFSWSPRSRLLALLNPAQWYLDGNLVTVEGSDLLWLPWSSIVPRSQVCFPWYPAIRRIPEIIRALIAIGYFTQEDLPELDLKAALDLGAARTAASQVATVHLGGITAGDRGAKGCVSFI